jgi:shikimate kinase
MTKIILLGYMGCGKSTIAKKLSKITKKSYVDLDEQIEKKTNLSINQIFESHGEIYFRKLEREVFIEQLQDPKDLIIGLGGGTPCYANNHELLNQEGVISIYLKGSVDTLYHRLVDNKSGRPILSNKTPEELKEFIAKHLFDRSFYYNQAQHKVVIDHISRDQVVDKIIQLLA